MFKRYCSALKSHLVNKLVRYDVKFPGYYFSFSKGIVGRVDEKYQIKGEVSKALACFYVKSYKLKVGIRLHND